MDGRVAFVRSSRAWARGSGKEPSLLLSLLPFLLPPHSAGDGQKAKEEQRRSQSTDTEQPRVVGEGLHAEQEPTAQRAEGRHHLTVR